MLLTLKLKRIRLREQKNLNRTNYLLFKNIVSYIKNSNLREIEKEEVLQQIMDMLLQAQAENKSIDLFIGKDYEVFCDGIIKEYESIQSEAYRVADYFQKTLLCFLAIIIVMTVTNWITHRVGEIYISLQDIVLAFSISFIAVLYSKKTRPLAKSLKSSEKVLIIRERLIRDRLRDLNILFWLVILLPSMIANIYGINMADYRLSIYNCLFYLMVLLVIIIGLTVYKRSLVESRAKN